jgi:simple sugar transport system permease protein
MSETVATGLGFWGIPLAMLAGALRVSPPFLFVSLGECLTERSGRINLGLEGTLVLGAMSAYGVSAYTHSPWLGVLAAGAAGLALGLLHGWLCGKPKVNDVAVGIALMFFGMGVAFFLGRPLIPLRPPQLPSIPLGFWSHVPQVRQALSINVLFVIGLLLAPLMLWGFRATKPGLIVRIAGESADAARAMGYSVNGIRLRATAAGGFLAGVGGAFLSLYYPGVWNEAISSGQGLMAVALVIFARWNPVYCFYAAMLFGGAGAIGPALQANGITSYVYLWGAAPYVLTLAIMIATCSPTRTFAGAPAELGASSR